MPVDAQDRLLTYSSNIVSRFVYTTSENVPEYFEKSDTIYRIITDHLGSVRQVVDAGTGAIIQKIDYDEYGNVFFDSRPGFTPFGYAGGSFDSRTKLIHFFRRDYITESGRWTTKDPIRFDGGVNLFAYVNADVINQIDIKGTDFALAASQGAVSSAFRTGIELMGAWGEEIFALMGCVITLSLASQYMVLGPSQPWRPYPGNDPTVAPGEEWTWIGNGPPGSGEGSWTTKVAGEARKIIESLFPDLNPNPHGPHWDWKDQSGKRWRIYPDGRIEPKP